MERHVVGNCGKYQLGPELGRGGFGVVYLARDGSDRDVALELIGPVSDASDKETFQREVKGAQSIKSRNVLQLIDFGAHESGGRPYLFTVTEFCGNGDFRKVLAAYHRDMTNLDRVISDFGQILDGLSALHEKIIHRDMKPENVLVSGHVLKIGDFGLSKLVDDATATLTFKGSGSPNYMAPEVWEMKRAVPATDLYAIGVMLFEAVTGQRPFNATDLAVLRDEHRFKPAPRVKTLNPQVPDRIDGIIKRLLDKEPSRRYQTAAALKEDLRSQVPVSDERIGAIVSGVRAHLDASEAEELAARKRLDDDKAEVARIRYKEQELLELFDDVVAEVNSHLPEAKIACQRHPQGRIYGLGRRQLIVRLFELGELYANPEVPGRMEVLKSRYAIHGGYVEIQQDGQDREGWNVVLVRPPEEMYGSWLLVESEASGLSSIRPRFSPVATRARLFADNLACHWARAIHVWNLKDKPLEKEDVVRILGTFVQSSN